MSNGFTIKYEPKRNKEKADRSNKVGDATFHVLILTPELTFSGKLAEDQQTVATELEKAIRRYPEFWWGWGLILTMRPDFIREARRRGDYATSILGKVYA